MKHEKSITIEAAPEKVWSLLMDGDPKHNWKSLESQLDGTLAPGEYLKVRNHRLANRLVTIQCSDFERGRCLSLSFKMRLFPSQGSFSWTLMPSAEGTLVTVQVTAQGPLVSFMERFLHKPLNDMFDQVLQSVKKQVEGAA